MTDKTESTEVDATWSGYFKSLVGLNAKDGVGGTGFGTSGEGQTGASASIPAPIKVSRQDSMPEIVSTPTDIGIFEVSHENGRGFSFARLFRDPRESPSAKQQTAAGKS